MSMCFLELGNMMFNTNENQQYECPKYIIALLDYLDAQLKRVMFNINHEEYDSPFENTGNTFETDVFKVQAYDWNDDVKQDYNFIYYVDRTKSNLQHIKISWYKYLGRDTTINQEIDSSIIVDMFDNCLKSILDYEKKYLGEVD